MPMSADIYVRGAPIPAKQFAVGPRFWRGMLWASPFAIAFWAAIWWSLT